MKLTAQEEITEMTLSSTGRTRHLLHCDGVEAWLFCIIYYTSQT